jgi:hypothetical protein
MSEKSKLNQDPETIRLEIRRFIYDYPRILVEELTKTTEYIAKNVDVENIDILAENFSDAAWTIEQNRARRQK